MSLRTWVQELGAIGGGQGGVNRFAWTDELMAANRWLLDRLDELGINGEVDPAGNVIARWAEGTGPAVLVGSHLDTVPNGGRFDGALGVLAGLEAIRRLMDEGFRPARPIWLAAFNDEEGTRFDTGMSGSTAFVGEALDGMADRAGPDGVTLSAAMAAAGFDIGLLPRARAIDAVGCYLEMHIEQGPILEAEGLDAAVVTGIVGLRGYRIDLSGQANHAGTTPMDRRRDALAGAARLILDLRDGAREAGDMTVNVGKIAVQPGGANVIPGTATLVVDIRAAEPDRYAALDEFVRTHADRAARAEALSATVTPTYAEPPVALDPALQDLLAAEMTAAGLRWRYMPSGAGHDAQVLARHVPSAMVFVPSRNGVSHSPDEFTAPAQYEPGIAVLTSTLRRLCG